MLMGERLKTQLRVLNLTDNQLSGSLEPLQGFAALERLDLAGNEFTGGLDPLKGCTSLQGLGLERPRG